MRVINPCFQCFSNFKHFTFTLAPFSLSLLPPLKRTSSFPLKRLLSFLSSIEAASEGGCVSLLRMNLQQAAQPRTSANGFNRRRVEKENSNRMDIKSQPGKSNPDRVTSAGITSGSRIVGSESPSRDRLVYLTTCLIGHHVEVQVKNGSVYSGIFHATSADKDFGAVLKMARLIKDVSLRAQKVTSDSVVKAPSKTLIIPANELVQIVAKDVPVTRDGLSNELRGESRQDIMLDSYISHSRHVEGGRELEPWMPDKDDPLCPELDNVFDSSWTGSWDQFKVNEKLFGVKSTFNEELYTTKLEKGPRTRELEEEARRIAREIEGEETHDLHLAEERGVNPYDGFDIDEETKYSAVYRGADDSGCADEDILLNSRDAETFGDSTGPAFGRSFADVASGKSGKGFEGGRVPSRSTGKDEIHPTQFNANQDFHCSGSLASDHSSNAIDVFEDDNRVQGNYVDDQGGKILFKETLSEDAHSGKADGESDLQPSWNAKRSGSEKTHVSSLTATTSDVNTKPVEKTSSSELIEDSSGKGHVLTEPTNSRGRPGSSASSTSETGAATTAPSGPALSPSSSMGSLSSEKSTLNPNAKEFKFNPNAKCFVPTQSPLRPPSPVNDASFYFPSTMPTVPHMHGMPVGMGVGPSFVGPQPMLFNPQAAGMQSPQAYFPANGPQMILGHPRQVMYMPGYPAEMPYKGREY
ncbi:polyadenylate-binding protein-interacting protein 3-like isoform X2 [Chenopodium quinoa]|uniref:polyadenylate-binding protein-interacting protein 3-like isoform X2 n=1 Tax=Chenopodium quinoa TaxID=63459 RepID=UPI000B77AA79|nr:polyadenylate-binding protein-interacting protein 3-like isoform X2 [Chenopodium quinoa]